MANYFDRFDAAPSGNFFDRFDAVNASPAPAPARSPMQKVLQPVYDASGAPTGQMEEVDSINNVGPNPVDSLGRGLIQGATLGAGDEIWAAGAGAISKLTGGEFGPAYDSALASSQASNKAASDAHPWVYTGGQVAGAVPGLVYGGSTALGGRALGITGSNLATRSAASAASGGTIGGIQGFAGTDGDLEARKAGGLGGAGLGLGIGAVTPATGAVIGAGAGAASRWLGQRGISIPGMPNSGMTMLADDMRNSGGAAAVNNRLAELGPDAMLLDASPSFQGRAQGLAVRPETRQTIVDPLAARDAGTNVRLAQGVDEAFGPAPVPSHIEARLHLSRQSMGPEYETVFRGARPVNTFGIANRLDALAATERGVGQRAMQNVRQMLTETNGDGLDRSARTLLNTRQAVDGMLATEIDPNAVRLLTQAREMVDYELARSVPGLKAVDARFEELARQSAGLQRGSQILDLGKTAIRPSELADEMARGAVPRAASPNAGPFSTGDAQFIGPSGEAFRMRQGVRGQVDRAMGVKANDLVALRQQFMGEGDFNRQKLSQVFGDNNVRDVARLLDREHGFRDTYRRIDQNSMTAQRTAAADAVKPRGENPSPSDAATIAGISVLGGPKALALAGGVKAGRYGLQRSQNAADIARNQAMANALLLRDGPQRDQFIAALGEYLIRGERAATTTEMTRRLTQALLQQQGNQASEAIGGRQLLLAR